MHYKYWKYYRQIYYEVPAQVSFEQVGRFSTFTQQSLNNIQKENAGLYENSQLCEQAKILEQAYESKFQGIENELQSPYINYQPQLNEVNQIEQQFNKQYFDQFRPIKERHKLINPYHFSWEGQFTYKVKVKTKHSLQQFFQLPIKQLESQKDNLLKYHGQNLFIASIPKLNLLALWVQPLCLLEAQKILSQNEIKVRATKCSLQGSELIKRLNIQDKYSLSFNLQFRWHENQFSEQQLQSLGQNLQNIRLENHEDDEVEGYIQGDLRFDLWLEIPPPLDVIPVSYIQKAGDYALASLIPPVMRQQIQDLVDDYYHWSQSQDYRNQVQLKQNI